MFDPISDLRGRVRAADLREGHLLLHANGTHLIENAAPAAQGKRALTLRNIRTGETSTVEADADDEFRQPMLMPSVVAAAIGVIDTSDPEHAHGLLDAILLHVAPPEVQEAAARLQEQTRWWAGA